MMGYSKDVATKALIETKNVGMIEAIDAIPTIMKSLKENKESANDKEIKAWGCPDCTFINAANTHFCEVCDKEAPEDTYISNFELIPI